MLNSFRNAIRQFADMQRRRGIAGQFIRYQIMPDEANDPTLISQRVYGVRTEAQTIMAAAGASFIWDDLQPGEEIILPTAMQLRQIKQMHGEA